MGWWGSGRSGPRSRREMQAAYSILAEESVRVRGDLGRARLDNIQLGATVDALAASRPVARRAGEPPQRDRGAARERCRPRPGPDAVAGQNAEMRGQLAENQRTITELDERLDRPARAAPAGSRPSGAREPGAQRAAPDRPAQHRLGRRGPRRPLDDRPDHGPARARCGRCRRKSTAGAESSSKHPRNRSSTLRSVAATSLSGCCSFLRQLREIDQQRRRHLDVRGQRAVAEIGRQRLRRRVERADRRRGELLGGGCRQAAARAPQRRARRRRPPAAAPACPPWPAPPRARSWRGPPPRARAPPSRGSPAPRGAEAGPAPRPRRTPAPSHPSSPPARSPGTPAGRWQPGRAAARYGVPTARRRRAPRGAARPVPARRGRRTSRRGAAPPADRLLAAAGSRRRMRDSIASTSSARADAARTPPRTCGRARRANGSCIRAGCGAAPASSARSRAAARSSPGCGRAATTAGSSASTLPRAASHVSAATAPEAATSSSRSATASAASATVTALLDISGRASPAAQRQRWQRPTGLGQPRRGAGQRQAQLAQSAEVTGADATEPVQQRGRARRQGRDQSLEHRRGGAGHGRPPAGSPGRPSPPGPRRAGTAHPPRWRGWPAAAGRGRTRLPPARCCWRRRRCRPRTPAGRQPPGAAGRGPPASARPPPGQPSPGGGPGPRRRRRRGAAVRHRARSVRSTPPYACDQYGWLHREQSAPKGPDRIPTPRRPRRDRVRVRLQAVSRTAPSPSSACR